MNHVSDAIQASLDAKLRAQLGNLVIANMAQQAEIDVLRAELARLSALRESAAHPKDSPVNSEGSAV